MIEMLKHLKPYRTKLILVLVFSLAAILFELYLPTLMAEIVDIGIVNQDVPFILRTGALMLLCSFMAIVLMVGVSYFASKVSLGFGRDMRRRIFVHVEHFSLQEYEKFGSASLITRTTNDVKVVQDVINMMQRMMTRAPLMLVGGVLLAVSRDRYLSLIFLAALPVLAIVIFFVARKAIPLFSSLQKKTDRLTLILREALTGVRVVRAFNRVDYEKNRFNIANEDFRDTGIKVGKLMAFMFPIMLIIMNFTNIAIVWFGAIRIEQGDMQVGNLLAFIQYAAMILMSLIMLSMAFIMIPRAQVSAKRLNEVLLTKPLIKDPINEEVAEGGAGLIEFNSVTFRYEGAEKPVLEDISFVAKPGETTAIIGSTGAGKSTLLQLIPRFYDVESGSISIDGVNIQNMLQSTLRGKIGYVPQKATLFSGTIAENMRYGNDQADEAEILAALKTAQALDFVEKREKGMDSMLEQAGSNLSGGQKQRLSIARSLVRKPKIYLFDDSFSALDYQTDRKLRDALKQETANATILVVAQRVNTVKDAEKIIVLNDGKIAGIGTHAELLNDNIIYQEIVASQQNGEVGA
ncbi:ATP-binding cassette subfamily B protein [Metabacillus crassostreae]|uniref:ABC transporter ATP-binding protein n=1 Tax=Metabacillus crassostreae TaxID=929098 RepID=UPI00195B5DA5|nr:ABC transporter ATP-binding protein [Metabacillus crassostreae]MBM7605600.1 ATP-binding cassette subfamily B protein [Metabacillus crassostreae]